MSHAGIALSKDLVGQTSEVSALTAHLVKKGYRVTLVNYSNWLELTEIREQMRKAVVDQLYILTLVNAKEEHYCSAKVWMTDGQERPFSPPEDKLEVFLHLGYKEPTARIDVSLASDDTRKSEQIKAHIRTIVEDALGLGGKITWEKADC